MCFGILQGAELKIFLSSFKAQNVGAVTLTQISAHLLDHCGHQTAGMFSWGLRPS